MRQSALGWSLLVASTCLLAPAQAVSTTGWDVRGLLTPNDPLLVTGELQFFSPLPSLVHGSLDKSQEPVIFAEQLVFTQQEWTWWSPIPATEPNSHSTVPGARHERTEWALARPTIETEDADGENRWRWLAKSQGGHGRISAAQECQAAPSNPAPEAALLGSEPAWLIVQCARASVEMTTNEGLADTMELHGTNVEVKGFNTSTGQPLTRHVVTGTFATPRVDAQGNQVYENVVRVLTMSLPFDSSSQFKIQIHDASGVTIWTPLMSAAGTLVVPPFVGLLTWNDQTVRESSIRQSWSGNFVLVAQRSSLGRPTVELMGYGAPRAAAPVDGISAGTAALIAGTGLSVLLITGGWLLYARLASARVLSHPARNRIASFISENIGSRPFEVANALRIPRKTLHHHLQILERSGFIQIKHYGRRTLLFPANRRPPDNHPVAATRGGPLADAILALIADGEPHTQAEIANTIGTSRQTVSRILRHLAAAGQVRRFRRARGTLYEL